MIIGMIGSTLAIRSEMRFDTTYRKSGCFDAHCSIEIEEFHVGDKSFLKIKHFSKPDGDSPPAFEELEILNERGCHEDFIAWAQSFHGLEGKIN